MEHGGDGRDAVGVWKGRGEAAQRTTFHRSEAEGRGLAAEPCTT
jgi:hypothetical protein